MRFIFLAVLLLVVAVMSWPKIYLFLDALLDIFQSVFRGL